MSGKGDKYRPVDKIKWDKNYNLIFNKKSIFDKIRKLFVVKK